MDSAHSERSLDWRAARAETTHCTAELGGSNAGLVGSRGYLGAREARLAERAMVEGKEEIQGARVGMVFPVTETRENQHAPPREWHEPPGELTAGRKPGCGWQMNVLEAIGLE